MFPRVKIITSSVIFEFKWRIQEKSIIIIFGSVIISLPVKHLTRITPNHDGYKLRFSQMRHESLVKHMRICYVYKTVTEINRSYSWAHVRLSLKFDKCLLSYTLPRRCWLFISTAFIY